jgi:hypothetical protein
MNRRKWVILVSALALIGGAAVLLSGLRGNQRLSAPAVKTRPTESGQRLAVILPERVLDYDSKEMEIQKIELDMLPPDTSFGRRLYTEPGGFGSQVSVVLMGTDRTSLHKPEFCLEGQGWHVDTAESGETVVPMEKPVAYKLPVMKLVAHKEVDEGGQPRLIRAVYVFWFVAPNEYTAHHWQRMWWMAKDLLTTGVLKRWAYVSYLAICRPGEEEATFERLKKLIAASVPEFQLTPAAAGTVAAASP